MKFSGKVDEVDFEMFMVRMEEAMDVEGVTDKLRLEYIENWFSGLPLDLVKAFKDNRKEDASIVFQAIKEVLREQFGSKKFDTEAMLKKMVEGGPIAGGDFEKIQGFVIGLRCKFELAKGKDNAGSFDSLKTYYEILRLKLPHLVRKWTERFENGNEEISFQNFENFVMETARIQQTNAIIMKSTSQFEDRDPRDVSTSVRSRSDSGLSEGVSGEDSNKATDAGLPVTGRRGTTRVCGCPLCGDAHLLMRCQRFLRKAPIQRWKFCKQERLCLRCLGGDHFSKHCRHMSCSECGEAHHSLLHREKRTYSSSSSESDYL